MSSRSLVTSFALLVIGLLPAGRLKNRVLSAASDWQIHPRAVIDPVVLWRIGTLEVGDSAHLGPGTVFRDLHQVRLGDHAGIGQFNWVTCTPNLVEPGGGSLQLAEGAALTSRHYVDCTGGISIGPRSIVGGVRTSLLSHQVDTAASVVRSAGIEIGAECLISTNVVITPGRRLTDRCIVAAGAVVGSDLLEPESLYGGVPARRLGARPGEAYFERTRGELSGDLNADK